MKGRRTFAECSRRCDQHFVGHPTRTGGDQPETNGREDVNIVALSDRDPTTFEVDQRKRRARRDEGAPASPSEQVLRNGFRTIGRIRQGENDRTFDLPSHFADDGFGESTAEGREPDQNRGADVSNYG